MLWYGIGTGYQSRSHTPPQVFSPSWNQKTGEETGNEGGSRSVWPRFPRPTLVWYRHLGQTLQTTWLVRLSHAASESPTKIHPVFKYLTYPQCMYANTHIIVLIVASQDSVGQQWRKWGLGLLAQKLLCNIPYLQKEICMKICTTIE